MQLSHWFIISGIVLVGIGLLIWVGIPFGKLPGDITLQKGKSHFYIPIVSSIIISILLTIGLNLFFWLIRKG